MAYSKLRLYEHLLGSNLPDDSYFESDLIKYFPSELQDKYIDEIKTHPLRREIIATTVTNSIINSIGGSMFYQLCEDSGLPESEVARAFTVAREVFSLSAIWGGISELQTTPEIQKALFMELQALVERASIWFMNNIPNPIEIANVIEDYSKGVKILAENLSKILTDSQKKAFDERYAYNKKAGVPDKLAQNIAGFEFLSAACDVVQVARLAKLPVELVGQIYFEIGSKLNLRWMRQSVLDITPHSYWQRISAKTLIDDIYEQQKRLVMDVIKHLHTDNNCTKSITRWEEKNQMKISQFDRFITDIKAHDEHDLSMIVLALRKVKDIVPSISG